MTIYIVEWYNSITKRWVPLAYSTFQFREKAIQVRDTMRKSNLGIEYRVCLYERVAKID
jgi:hypothetical protein